MIAPSSGVGGWTPTPRNERPARTRMLRTMSAIENTREDVASVLVGAHPVMTGRRLEGVEQVLGEGVVWGDPRREDRGEHVRRQDHGSQRERSVRPVALDGDRAAQPVGRPLDVL